MPVVKIALRQIDRVILHPSPELDIFGRDLISGLHAALDLDHPPEPPDLGVLRLGRGSRRREIDLQHGQFGVAGRVGHGQLRADQAAAPLALFDLRQAIELDHGCLDLRGGRGGAEKFIPAGVIPTAS